MKILVPIDFTHPSEQSIEKIHTLFPGDKPVEIHLLHVVDVSPIAFYPEAMAYYQDWETQAMLYAEKTLVSIKDKYSFPNLTFQTSVARGDTVDHILTYCQEKNIDLIVMPTHGRKGLPRFFLGSVSEKIVRLAPVPVYTYKVEL